MIDKRKGKPKRTIKKIKRIWIFSLSIISLATSFFIYSLSLQNVYYPEDSYSEDNYVIMPEVLLTTEYLFDNPIQYDDVIITSITPINYLGSNWELCFLGLQNPSGVISINGRTWAYLDFFHATPEPSEGISIASSDPFCQHFLLSTGLNLISYNVYGRQQQYQWAIEIE